MTVYCGPMHAGQVVEVILIVVLGRYLVGRWLR